MEKCLDIMDETICRVVEEMSQRDSGNTGQHWRCFMGFLVKDL